MFDNTPLEQEEISDQCRALIYAVIESKQPQVKQILTFIIWERLDWLYQDFSSEEAAQIQ